MQEKSLLNVLSAIPQEHYSSQSRVHRLASFDTSNCQCFVKRDDELGFGISGSKIRKYRSLIPFLRSQNFKKVVVIGSGNSNHVLSIVQLLIENHIHPILFLRGEADRLVLGNGLLTRVLVNDSDIYWLSRQEWPFVEQKAKDYAEKQEQKTFVLAEGGSTLEALPGMLTLPIDILRNEKELGIEFTHLFIEAGTGLMASSVILGWHWLEKKTIVHVLLIAETEEDFLRRLHFFHQEFEKLVKEACPFPENFILHKPKQLASFGSINLQLFKEISQLAQREGFLTDPIYTAKLFVESKRILQAGDVNGNVLINHSGGALTLFGFQEHLKKFVKGP